MNHPSLLKNRMRALLLAWALTCFSGNADVQGAQLSEQQRETIRLFLQTPLPRYVCLCEGLNVPMSQVMTDAVNDIDPILVSKHLIFAKHWLKFVGDDKDRQVTRQQFTKWTENLDRLFECYEQFMGLKPYETDVIFINLHLQQNPSKGIAHAFIRTICVNAESGEPFDHLLSEIRHHGTPHYFMFHELAHCFSMGGPLAQRPWTGELETVAELLVSYALEQGGLEFGYPSKVAGTLHRRNLLKASADQLASGTIKPFSYDRGSGYALYMLGLVDKVGWETLTKVIHSYHDGTYTPTKKYDDSQTVLAAGKYQFVYPHRVHEFFDRVAHFHDRAREHAKTDSTILQTIPAAGRALTGEEVLRSFPDRGWFMDECFSVDTVPPSNPTR